MGATWKLPWGPKDHTNIRILHPGAKAQNRGIPEIIVCRILMFRWSLGPLSRLLQLRAWPDNTKPPNPNKRNKMLLTTCWERPRPSLHNTPQNQNLDERRNLAGILGGRWELARKSLFLNWREANEETDLKQGG